MDSLSMVQRSGNQLIVRSVVSGDQLYSGGRHGAHHSAKHQSGSKSHLYDSSAYGDPNNDSIEEIIDTDQSTTSKKDDDDSNLPQCKIKRNYSCNNCSYFTQNPRHFLAHLRDIHGEKIIINECKHCLYASRHYQKLVRHMKMVHGSTDGLEEQAQSRKRASQLAREEKKRKQHLIASIGGQAAAAAAAAVAAAAAMPQLSTLNVANLTEAMNNVQAQQPSIMVNTKAAMPTPSTSAPQPVTLESATNAEMLNQKFLKCTLCDYTTLYRTQMVEHEREQHNRTKFFRCTKCSYVTHIKSRYSKHVKYHSMPMIKCVMCDFRTPYKWNLDRHMKNHGGAGPFKCSACNFTADIKQSLTVHEMNHHVPPVGHATGMSMARRRNKVGGTDLVDADYGMMAYGDHSDGAEAMDNNNSDDNSSEEARREQFENDMIEEDDYQMLPADLSQKAASPPARKPARPLPNLIPIQPMMNASDAVNLSVRNRSLESLLKSEQNEIRVNPQSCLKDLASVFGSDDMLDVSETSQMSPVSNASSAKPKSSFFAELKEKGIECANLVCECGHSAKCLSEAMRHKRMCTKRSDKSPTAAALSLIMNNMGTSTRCQYCRHRCKTSADLFVHMQKCAEARSSAESCDSASEIDSSNNDKVDVSGDLTDDGMIDLTTEPHPMENKVFVWNTLPQPIALNANKQPDPKSFVDMQRDDLITQVNEEADNNDDEKADENSYFGIETAPGYGEVTQKMNPDDEALHTSLKKVFKCPHCSFWASTASRFHVHIVGHLNKKPFECSLCSYRSNWRWDITKHIRLKTLRDVSHKSAKVLMNDETGRRNYTKYNKYITLMKVTGEDGDPKQMKSGEMTPNQEAAASRRRIDTTPDDDDDDKPMSLAQNALLFSLSNNSVQMNADDRDRQGDGDSNLKRTSFKCKKCNFRDASRDVVYAHVKEHYKEANIAIDEQSGHSAANALSAANEFNNNVYVNGILSALTANNGQLLLQAQQQLAKQQNDQTLPQIRIQTLNQLSGNPSIFLADLKQQQHQQVQPLTISSITQNASNQSLQTANTIPITNNSITSSTTNTTTTSTTTTSATNENGGEMDEANSGLNSVNGWRGTAPYRCGHCHQVSNWKHVIQRHCRLKHDGDIQIEIKVKGSNDQYQPLNMQNNQATATTSTPNTSTSTSEQFTPSISLATTSNNKEMQSLSFLTKQYPIKLPVTSDSLKATASDPATQKEPNPLLNINDINLQTLDADQQNLLINLLAKQQILFNGNILTLIKPTDIVRCSKCNFEAPNDFILSQHIQVAHSNADGNVIDVDLGSVSQTTQNGNARSIDLDDAIAKNRLPNNKRNADEMDGASKHMTRGKERRQSERLNRDEKCPHCPFVGKSDVLKEHMHGHFNVSGQRNAIPCNFCDFSSANDELATEHNHIHFGLIKSKQKPVAFYTSYDNLEITTIDQQNNNNTNQNGNNNNDSSHQNPYANTKTLYPKIGLDLHSSSDKENKILVDIETGHIVK